jgi:hypothetical protein
MPIAKIGLWTVTMGLGLSGLRAQDAAFPDTQVKVGGGTIDVSFGPGKIDLPEAKVLGWIKNAAEAVAAYYGRFPVAHTRLLVRPADGRHGVFNGTTWGSMRGKGPFTRISLGQHTTEEELNGDWMMTHELVHLAFPDVEGDDRSHHWIEEGMATYIEPIGRAMTGQLSPERVWGEMARYMPQGLPEDGDRGLDNTHTWGRTYWGGALFWLVADVRIREKTDNRKGLQDAMRGILKAGGNIEEEWPIERILKAGDKAVGGTMLMNLYIEMKDKPVQVDLADIWKRLGVLVSKGVVSFDDAAPLAKARKSITAK